MFVLSVTFLGITALVTAAWYVQPVKLLNLDYSAISIPVKILDMIQRRTLEVRLSEEDLNNLVKASLAKQTELPNHFKLTGAEATQRGDYLIVDVNAIWRSRIAIGATLTYRMSYREPELILTRESVTVKQFTIPPQWLQMPAEMRFNLYDRLPKHVGIQTMAFDSSGVRMTLKLR